MQSGAWLRWAVVTRCLFLLALLFTQELGMGKSYSAVSVTYVWVLFLLSRIGL
jgi:hypothetical protein